MYNIELDKQIILQVKEKCGGISVAAIERKFNAPKNILHNTRLNNVAIPKELKSKMYSFLMEKEPDKTDKWEKLSPKMALKYQFPKWLRLLHAYCKEKNIPVSELIETHRRLNS